MRFRQLTSVAVALTAVAVLSQIGDAPAVAGTPVFNPADIISNGVFFDSTSMSVADVQAFLTAKGASCVPGSDGSPCLKDYRVDTPTRAADTFCPGGYQGALQESAAQIIAKVAVSCGISPKVLLVTLQKEQGLVTSRGGSSLGANSYLKAMGYGCPDSSACDSTYYGLANQVYYGARQFRRYVVNPTQYGFQAGVPHFTQYYPNTACGGTTITPANSATAALYNYTPYQPNAAALAAGYGVAGNKDGVYTSDPNDGDCATYGNRNFFRYFTDWFVSTHFDVSPPILAFWQVNAAVLGDPTGSTTCGLRDGGCTQAFQGGYVQWSSATGPHITRGAILNEWLAQGSEKGPLAYPTMNESGGLKNGGAWQAFQGGYVHWSPATGAHATRGGILIAWVRQGSENGRLGYPLMDEADGLKNGGAWQAFQGGYIDWSPATGAHVTRDGILNEWVATGAQNGPLGYPTMDESGGLKNGGAWQAFQGGYIHWSPATSAHATRGGILNAWVAQGSENGLLGYPLMDEADGLKNGGAWQAFQGGYIHWSPATGAHITRGGILNEWASTGSENGPLGYPTMDEHGGLKNGGAWQAFQGGYIHWSPTTGAHATRGAILNAWVAQGSERGRLGYPTADARAVNGGESQAFQGGTITVDSSGRVTVSYA